MLLHITSESDSGPWFIFRIFLYMIIFQIILWKIYQMGYRKIKNEYQAFLNQMDDIYRGNYQTPCNLWENSLFARESQKLSMLGCQMQQKIEEQVKAEKMKIDLITNVSHDLKTPLTSIISYIDLLSKEDLDSVAREYVNVLERKSERLRKMIQDVFILTKAASGNLEAKKEKLELNKLLIQVLTDMEGEKEQSCVKVVEQFCEDSVYVMSDGDKLYRIFQNLFENALKYSLADTRVYIILEKRDGRAIITVKNVAAYEMNFSGQDALGRFFRGDKARSSEGSGLGLAIAQEFAELCGGELKVKIDGDVFEVCLVLRGHTNSINPV